MPWPWPLPADILLRDIINVDDVNQGGDHRLKAVDELLREDLWQNILVNSGANNRSDDMPTCYLHKVVHL
jgi:hypothetical protein